MKSDDFYSLRFFDPHAERVAVIGGFDASECGQCGCFVGSRRPPRRSQGAARLASKSVLRGA